jgi:hypothetical protein
MARTVKVKGPKGELSLTVKLPRSPSRRMTVF